MKRLYLIALFALVCGGASAQENGNRDAQNRVVWNNAKHAIGSGW